MTPSADLSVPRRPLFFPVVIATVFLTIIGMAGGFVLGERHRRGLEPAAAPITSTPAPPRPSGPGCPPEASEKAQEAGRPTQLTQILRIVTNRGAIVWICQDGNGSLYFQSKTGGVDSQLVQGKNGLFLIDVQRTGDDAYEARAYNGNLFEVSRQHLQVRFVNGQVQDSVVTSAE